MIPQTQPFFKLSLAQWSLHKTILEHKTLSLYDFALRAKQLGFDAVEYVSRFYPVGDGGINAWMRQFTTEIATRSSDAGITNLLIMVDGEGDLAAANKAERDTAVANHSKWVAAAAALGCHSIRVNLSGAEDYDVWKDTAPEGLAALCDYTSTYGLNIIVENHGGLSSDAGKLAGVIKKVNRENCGTLPDFGNFCIRRGGDGKWPNECLEAYDRYKGVAEMMPFAKGVSAKSYNFDAEGNETTIDYLKMLGIVKASGYTGHIGIEYEGQRLGEEEGILKTRELLLKVAGMIY
ncbi:sugar phosphate isomerase/epimerase family protein [Flavobacterium sp. RHBU_24]|uniref:sugar phosphate isomerase/epimerase family protein n=1 Tax=Flavobacterium sp. RHBU_24 TaxID=3391185 RepID=UPI00398464F1